jgi:hypothetical protein
MSADSALHQDMIVRGVANTEAAVLLCRTYGARIPIAIYPPFRLRVRSALGWANLWSRLQRLNLRCYFSDVWHRVWLRVLTRVSWCQKWSRLQRLDLSQR